MFDYIKKLGRGAGEKKSAPEAEVGRISLTLAENMDAMREIFRNDNDFVVREFIIPISGGKRAAAFFIDGLVKSETVNNGILAPLMIDSRKVRDSAKPRIEAIKDIVDSSLLSAETKISGSLEDACGACLAGDTVLMVDGMGELAYFNTKGFESRAVTEPQTEVVVRGSREGFTEVLRVNTSLIRRKLKTTHLRMEVMTIGEKSGTLVCLTYLDNVANPGLIAEVKRRLRTIDTDAVLDSGAVEEFIEDSPLSVFHTINYTEKPDIVAARLLEGRCALVVDGTPFVLTMPMLLIESFQSPEDYAIGPYFAVFLRLIRLVAFFVSLVAPAVYVALATFHQELIPTPLLFTIAASSEDLPFPSVVETAIMLLTFEILREAGVRMPSHVGQAVSTVGALVMGQAAIQAGIVGAPVVIVIAFTAVASFLAPDTTDAVSVLRWILLLMAALMGGFGIVIGLFAVMIHLASLESFGSMYLYPFAPFNATDLKDSFVRVPLWRMRTRPEGLYPQDKVRQNMSKPEFGRGGKYS